MADSKGEFNGKCNRTACQKLGANFYNWSTRKYYCGACAKQINEHNDPDVMQRVFGHALCTLADGTGQSIN